GDRQVSQCAQGIIVAPANVAGDFERTGLAGECREHAFAFEPRQELADALVDAAAEADMPCDAPDNVIFVWAFPMLRVAIGGAEKHQHLLALVDRNAANLDRARRGAEEGLHWALIAHRLLKGGAGQPRI